MLIYATCPVGCSPKGGCNGLSLATIGGRANHRSSCDMGGVR